MTVFLLIALSAARNLSARSISRLSISDSTCDALAISSLALNRSKSANQQINRATDTGVRRIPIWEEEEEEGRREGEKESLTDGGGVPPFLCSKTVNQRIATAQIFRN